MDFDLSRSRFVTVTFKGDRNYSYRSGISRFEATSLSDSEIPKEAFVVSGHRKVTDFIAIDGSMAVRSEVRDLIEELEPNVHQFFPVSLNSREGMKRFVHLDKSEVTEPYYLINIRSRLDGVCLERSKVVFLGGKDKMLVARFPGGKVVLLKDVVSGRSVWQGRHQLFTNIFFSSELVKKIIESKWKGLRMDYCEEV